MSHKEAVYETALNDIINVLGPKPCKCPEQHCVGMVAEIAEALRIARTALRQPDPPKDTGDANQAVSVAPGALPESARKSRDPASFAQAMAEFADHVRQYLTRE